MARYKVYASRRYWLECVIEADTQSEADFIAENELSDDDFMREEGSDFTLEAVIELEEVVA